MLFVSGQCSARLQIVIWQPPYRPIRMQLQEPPHLEDLNTATYAPRRYMTYLTEMT